MKVHFAKKVYDQFDPEDQASLNPVPCDCVVDGKPLLECDSCDGGGVVYEWILSAEESAEIQENLRKQGVPLGKIGTH